MSHKVDIKKTSPSELEINGEIPWEELVGYRAGVIKKFSENIKLDGFRPGHAPEAVLVERVGIMSILQEMAELALVDTYPKIIEENKIEAIDRPNIHITKLAEGNPLGFKIIQAILPEIKLPDYKNIAKDTLTKFDKEKEEVIVTDEELELVLTEVRKSRKKSPTDEGEPLPELTDELVKKMGEFENVIDFKTKIRGNLKAEKEMKQADKRRMTLVEALLASTDVPLPLVLVERQNERNLEHMRDTITRMGMKFEDYLKHSGKSEDDIKKESRPEAEKKVRINLLLEEIAKVEKIVVPKTDIEREAKRIMEHYNHQHESAEQSVDKRDGNKPDPHAVEHYV